MRYGRDRRARGKGLDPGNDFVKHIANANTVTNNNWYYLGSGWFLRLRPLERWLNKHYQQMWSRYHGSKRVIIRKGKFEIE